MKLAQFTNDETQRIEALHKLQILDSGRDDERFNRITRICHYLLDVPSVFITLVDKNRIWFKSTYGCQQTEEPRDVSFCGHAICNNVTDDILSRFFEVIDAKNDDRFSNNSFLIDQCGARYYMGFVLQSNDRRNIGTFCVSDTRPRNFSLTEKKLFSDLGMMAENEINNFPLNNQFSNDKNPKKLSYCAGKPGEKLLQLADKLLSVQKLFDNSLRTHGIDYKEWRILNAIMELESASPILISRKIGIAPPLMSKKLDTLEVKSLIKRTHSRDGDRRFVHLTCSDKGVRCWNKGFSIANELASSHLDNVIWFK